MTLLKSFPSDSVLLNVFKSFPATAKPLIEYHEVLLRGPSPQSVTERELIEGLGIKTDSEYFSLSAKRLHDGGYSGLLRILGQ